MNNEKPQAFPTPEQEAEIAEWFKQHPTIAEIPPSPRCNRAPSALRFPSIEGPDGKGRRLRIPRPTLRQIAARLRILNRFIAARDVYTKGTGFNPYRVERQELIQYIERFLNGALKEV